MRWLPLLALVMPAMGCHLLGAAIPCVDDLDCPLEQRCEASSCVAGALGPPPGDGGVVEPPGDAGEDPDPLEDGGVPLPDAGRPDIGCDFDFNAVVDTAAWLDATPAVVADLGTAGTDQTLKAVAALGDDAIVAGQVAGLFNLNGAAGNIAIDSATDAFVGRVSNNGFFRWAVIAGQPSSAGETIDAVAVDDTGCVYVGGSGDGAMTFPGCPTVEESAGFDVSGFVAQLDPADGRCRWLIPLPTADNGRTDRGAPVALTPRAGGGVIAAISAVGEVADTGGVDDEEDLLLLSASVGGNTGFVRRFGSPDAQETPRAILIDGARVLVCGSVPAGGGHDLGGGAFTVVDDSAFIAAYDIASGAHLTQLLVAPPAGGSADCRAIARGEAGLAAVINADSDQTSGEAIELFGIDDGLTTATLIVRVDGAGNDRPLGLAAANGRDAFAIVGSTSSSALDVGGVVLAGSNATDALVIEVVGANPSGRRFGGDLTDSLRATAVSAANDLWLVGEVMSADVDIDGTPVGFGDNIQVDGLLLRFAP